METEKIIALKQVFNKHPQLATSIHKGGNVDADFNSLAELSKIPLNFLLMHKGYIQRLVFQI